MSSDLQRFIVHELADERNPYRQIQQFMERLQHFVLCHYCDINKEHVFLQHAKQ